MIRLGRENRQELKTSVWQQKSGGLGIFTLKGSQSFHIERQAWGLHTEMSSGSSHGEM